MSEGQDVLWRKSSYSQSGACVEVAVLQAGTIGVRDSKNPAGPKLTLTRPAWAVFLTEAKRGCFDL
jgi:hypothetical protein